MESGLGGEQGGWEASSAREEAESENSQMRKARPLGAGGNQSDRKMAFLWEFCQRRKQSLWEGILRQGDL